MGVPKQLLMIFFKAWSKTSTIKIKQVYLPHRARHQSLGLILDKQEFCYLLNCNSKIKVIVTILVTNETDYCLYLPKYFGNNILQ